PEEQRSTIIAKYDMLQAQAEKPFFAKSWNSLRILAFELPPFERAWILLSVIIPILLLLRREGAAKAAWLLPIVALLYAASNYAYGEKTLPPADEALFPSEKVLVKDYLKAPLSVEIFEQREQL